jgi:hypothetical protein
MKILLKTDEQQRIEKLIFVKLDACENVRSDQILRLKKNEKTERVNR